MVYDDKPEFVGWADERRQAVGEVPLFRDVVETVIERYRSRAEAFAEQAIEEGGDPLDVLQDGRTSEDSRWQVRQAREVPVGADNATCTLAGVRRVDSLLAGSTRELLEAIRQRGDENGNVRNERPNQYSHYESLDTRRIGRNRTSVHGGGTV